MDQASFRFSFFIEDYGFGTKHYSISTCKWSNAMHSFSKSYSRAYQVHSTLCKNSVFQRLLKNLSGSFDESNLKNHQIICKNPKQTKFFVVADWLLSSEIIKNKTITRHKIITMHSRLINLLLLVRSQFQAATSNTCNFVSFCRFLSYSTMLCLTIPTTIHEFQISQLKNQTYNC